MKRILTMLLTLAILLSILPTSALGAEVDQVEEGTTGNSAYRVAMITDFGSITDQSYNQATYDAVSAWCTSHTVDYTYYQPSEDSTQARVDAMEQAIADGYNTIVAPGWLFGSAIVTCAKAHEDVYFLALDIYQSDLIDETNPDDPEEIEIPANVALIRYREEIAGYLAGYAAVKLGYRHLAFLGGMAVPAVLRYGYGFMQGVDTAAIELNAADQVVIEYVYANQFYGDSDITAYMHTLYQEKGVEVAFACGGGVYTSVAEAALEVENAKVIGVDVDLAPIIDGTYKEGLTLTSAEKKLGNTVNHMLEELIINDNWSSYGGKENNFGLVNAENLSENYVGLPDSTLWGDTFTQTDYTQLVAKIIDGIYAVSDDTEEMPQTSCTVNDCGTIKGDVDLPETVSGICGENLTWTLDSDGVLTISGTGEMYDYSCTAPWDDYTNRIARVVIEEGCTSIGALAFSNCMNMTSVSLPSTLVSLGENAFWNCTALTSIALPASVASIAASCFALCTGLTEISVEDGNPAYTSINGVLFNKDGTLLICYPGGMTNTTYEVPQTVTKIGTGAFMFNAFISSVTIPESVNEIGEAAFWCCSALTEVYIRNDQCVIGEDSGTLGQADTTTIHAHQGSTADAYAQKYGYTFELDVDCDAGYYNYIITCTATCTQNTFLQATRRQRPSIGRAPSQPVKEPLLSLSESRGFLAIWETINENKPENGVFPTPICQLFQVHGSKFKPDPSRDGGKPLWCV